MTTCKACGAAIEFVRVRNASAVADGVPSRPMPVDKEPNELGEIGRDPANMARGFFVSADYDGVRYIAHWATCPNAEDFRNKAKQVPPPKGRPSLFD